jgi:hypothetical protein
MSLSARIFAAATFLVASAATNIRTQAQAPIGCTQGKNTFTCDKLAFARYFKNAKTVTIEPQSIGHNAEPQLENLVRALGKTLQPAPAELTFQLMPVDFDGVNYGPGERDIATFRIYAVTPQGTRGPLIWVENLVGEPDTPWPTAVHAIIQQFRSDIKNDL